MTRGARAFGLFVAAFATLSACADILGIDDGTPRTYDASITDASLPDTVVLPDVSPIDVVADVPIDVPTSPLACGASSCNALTQGCCRTENSLDAGPDAFSCVAQDASCVGLLVTCDEPANCTALGHPGDVCCANVPDGGSAATSTTCVAQAACKGSFVCEPGDDEMCAFDAGQSCKASISTIIGWNICKT